MRKLLIIAALVCTGAHAEFKDGNKLLADMNGGHSAQMNALGYVTGVADTLMGVAFCGPTSITAGQIYDMTKQYLEQYPATRHISADRIIYRVLSVAWPCAQRGQNL